MRKELVICVALVLLCVVFLGLNLGNLSYLKGDENYYFQGARRMIRDGDWITPRYHHHIRFEKPPLYYWLVAGSFKALGVSWPAARLVSVILGTITALLVYFLALTFFGRKEALLSFLVLVTNELFFRYSRLCVSDIAFVFLITSALFLFIKSYKNKNHLYFIISFVPMGLAVLTKGPVGPALIILTIFVFAIKERKHRREASVFNIRNIFFGILLFLAVASPWIIAMSFIHKEAFLGHVWSTEILAKALPGGTAKSFTEIALPYIKSIGYYIPVVLFSFLPWGLFLPFAVFSKKGHQNREGKSFILSWFWVVFIFFSIAGFKHTHYMLALSPALAIIVGVYLSGLSLRKPIFKKVIPLIAVISIAFFLSLTGLILPHLDTGAMRVFSLKVAHEIKEGDEIGMASRNFNIKKFGMYLNNLIFSAHELSGDDLAQYVRVNKKVNLVPFLKSGRRGFSLITKTDYLKYVPADLRQKTYILARHKVWKKIKSDKELLSLILSGELDGFKEEAYLISNQP